MRSLSGLLVLVAATMSVACTDALPTESIPSAPSATAAVIQLNRHAVGTAVGDTVRLTARVRSRSRLRTGPAGPACRCRAAT